MSAFVSMMRTISFSRRRILEILIQEQGSGVIEGYGRGHLFTNLRHHGHVFAR
jgi:hypothetical protein